MNVLDRIYELKTERGWTEYKLADESGLAQSTISSWYRKGLLPSVSSIECLCKAFGITLSQFFMSDAAVPVDLTEKQRELLQNFDKLSEPQQKALLSFLKSL